MRLCALIIAGLAIAQATDARIGRFGPVGQGLSAQEVAQVSHLAAGLGNAPWLILGFRSMIHGRANLTVFLHPDTRNERLQRGRIMHLVADDPPAVSRRSAWRVETIAAYAYVPTRKSREITGEADLSWPFAVQGEIDDETLLSVVGFVRSRPAIPGVPEGSEPRLVVAAPLSLVAQRSDHVIAAFRTGDAAVFRVWVIRKGGHWQVIKWDAAIA